MLGSIGSPEGRPLKLVQFTIFISVLFHLIVLLTLSYYPYTHPKDLQSALPRAPPLHVALQDMDVASLTDDILSCIDEL